MYSKRSKECVHVILCANLVQLGEHPKFKLVELTKIKESMNIIFLAASSFF
jgi:hypothetical protein